MFAPDRSLGLMSAFRFRICIEMLRQNLNIILRKIDPRFWEPYPFELQSDGIRQLLFEK